MGREKQKRAEMVIHLHFHRRSTGVTRSLESLLPALSERVESSVFGYGISLPGMSTGSFLRAVYGKRELIIHAHRNNEVLFALLLRLLGGRFRLFFTRHSATRPSRLTLWLMKKCDMVISLTREAADKLPLKSVIAWHGVDTALFDIADRNTMEEIDRKNIICVVGRVRNAKGQLVVMKALARLLVNNPDWGVVFIGKVDDREYSRSIVALAGEYGVTGQICFIPETGSIDRYYNASRLVITASFSEGFSLVCLEAIACGIPVIATRDVGIHSEVIKEGVNGDLFTAGDHEELRKLTEAWISGKRSSDRRQIRDSIAGRWDTGSAADRIWNVYLNRESAV